uniref:Transmembrane protein n=1 Tax=Strigamia maritima TaxID=126957 RepID=T1JJE7_STRMM
MSVIQQNSITGIEMEPPITVTTIPIMYQQPQVIMPQIRQSCPLIGFGVILFLLSVATLGLAGWAASITVKSHYAYASLGCSIFFLLTSFLCMYGGNDVANRKGSIITALVFGILGVIVGFVGIVTSVLAVRWIQDCKICDAGLSLAHFSIECSEDCLVAYLPIFTCVAILTLLQALVGLILSCSACCNACSCCTKEGFIVQPAPVTTFIHTTTQAQAPPPYKRLQEVDTSDIYGPNRYNPNF